MVTLRNVIDKLEALAKKHGDGVPVFVGSRQSQILDVDWDIWCADPEKSSDLFNEDLPERIIIN